MTTPDSTQTYHDRCHEFFEKTAPQKALETKFVQRASPLDGKWFLLTLVVAALSQGVLDLPQLAVYAKRLNPDITVTGQAFKERFTPYAVAWFKELLVSALQLSLPPGSPSLVPMLQSFSAVYLLDSSVVPLPAGLKKDFPGCGGVGAQAALKVYLLLDWLTGGYETLHVTNGRKADQDMGTSFLTGSLRGALWLFDLGFFSCDYLTQIAQTGSYFLCRLQAQVGLSCRDAAGQIVPFDLDRFLLRLPREFFEIEVLVGPSQVPARLIAAPTPRAQAQERRRRARASAHKHGRTPTQRSLQRCDWTLLLTNAPAAQLPTSIAWEVYCVRWQVELAFKLFKSELHLDETQATEKHRVQCEFYAKLIALLLFNQVTRVAENLLGEKVSPTQLFRRLRADADTWLQALGQGSAAALQEGLLFLAGLSRSAWHKRKRSTKQRLQVAADRAQQVQLTDPLGYLRGRFKRAADRLAAFQQRLSKVPMHFNAKCNLFQRTLSTPSKVMA
jgi:hypothetical protein